MECLFATVTVLGFSNSTLVLITAVTLLGGEGGWGQEIDNESKTSSPKIYPSPGLQLNSGCSNDVWYSGT